jgi:hypothetical protein
MLPFVFGDLVPPLVVGCVVDRAFYVIYDPHMVFLWLGLCCFNVGKVKEYYYGLHPVTILWFGLCVCLCLFV